MPQQGSIPFSFKSGAFRGMAPSSKSLPYGFELLENCYVSADGSEIRTMPGFVCCADPYSKGRTDGTVEDGYYADVYDSRRDAVEEGGAGRRWGNNPTDGEHLTHARPTHFHGFKQIRGRFIVFGETGLRLDPLYDENRTANTYITHLGYSSPGGSTTELEITLSANMDFSSLEHNTLAVGDWVYLERGSVSGVLDNQAVKVTQVGAATTRVTSSGTANANTIRVAFANSGSVSVSSGPIWKCRPDQGTNGNNPNIDRESLTSWTLPELMFPGSLTTPVRSSAFAAYVANRVPDYGDEHDYGKLEGLAQEPDPSPFVQVPATREWQRSRRMQKEIPFRLVPEGTNNRILLAAPGYGCCFQIPVTVPIDFLTGDADLGISWWGNDIYDRPRALGLPKPCVLTSADTDDHIFTDSAAQPRLPAAVGTPLSSKTAFGGSTFASREGIYQFRFTYADPVTGEESLPSDPISIDTSAFTATQKGLSFGIWFPGYLMPECYATQINVYRTVVTGGDGTFYYDRSIIPRPEQYGDYDDDTRSIKYGLSPAGRFNGTNDNDKHNFLVEYTAEYQEDNDLIENSEGRFLPALSQMPMGCKTIRTIRGWTMFGGAQGDTGRQKELFTGTLSRPANTGATGENVIVSRAFDPVLSIQNERLDTEDEGLGCAGPFLPPAYAGQDLVNLPDGTTSIFDWPIDRATFDRQINYVSNAGGACLELTTRSASPVSVRHRVAYKIRGAGALDTLNSSAEAGVGILLPRGRIQISEQARPDTVPATNTTIISDEDDGDVEGIARYNGQAVVATRSDAYLIGWSRSPIGIAPETATDQFGCVAANSMVEFDGGAAWISDRGPVGITGGGFRWIGQPLESYFYGRTARYKYDSEGMMRHAWACHDAERGLIYFGLYADRQQRDGTSTSITFRGTEYTWDTAPDEAKSRFPCDEILVYSYRQDAWSVWVPPFPIQWMEVCEDGDGDSRVFFMDQQGRLFAMDDTYAEWNSEPVPLNVTEAATDSSTVSFGTTFALAPVGSDRSNLNNGTYIVPGMWVNIESANINASEGFPNTTQRQTAKVVSYTPGATGTITFDRQVTVAVDDLIYVGVRHMTVKTNYVNLRGGAQNTSVSEVGVRYSQRSSDFVIKPLGQTTFMAANVRVAQRPTVTDSDTINTSAWQTIPYTSPDGESAPFSSLPNGNSVGVVGLGNNTGQVNDPMEMSFVTGRATGTNFQVQLEAFGALQLRLSDLYVGAQ